LLTERTPFWLLAASAALLLLLPIRKGDLAGYDDAVYAHIAQTIVESGDWIHIQSNGFPALEHPPGFVWMQAALFGVFGPSDFLAKLPSALAGVGVVLLTASLARRLVLDDAFGILAMFVMLATPYFIKYAAHGMTDVPFTFFFLGAVCAWLKADENPRWYAAVGLCVAYALLLRGLIGLAVPLTLVLDLWLRPRARRGSALLTLAAAFLPLTAWYAHHLWLFGGTFWEVQTNFLHNKISGDQLPSWRRFTGAFEYGWMLLKSYWPWLPFLVTGLWVTYRGRDRRYTVPWIWAGVMFAACSVGGSRVLRYLLPAYPAFAIFAAAGLRHWIPRRRLDAGMRWVALGSVAAAAGIAAFPPVRLHAEIIRPIAEAARAAEPRHERIAFYDSGAPRFDETAQIQWYGRRTLWILTSAEAFTHALSEPIARLWIVDAGTFDTYFALRSEVLARSGHLVFLRLSSPAPL
jgi:4-amino-4-deoxy-L-arabinose transferase-like glycosyltransferase